MRSKSRQSPQSAELFTIDVISPYRSAHISDLLGDEPEHLWNWHVLAILGVVVEEKSAQALGSSVWSTPLAAYIMIRRFAPGHDSADADLDLFLIKLLVGS